MKLSEAARLGFMLVKPVPYRQDNGHGGACGIGAALKAVSVPVSHFSVGGGFESFDAAMATWPWLAQPSYEKSICACSSSPLLCFASYLAHLFDFHVFGCGEPCLTLEDWLAYVESVEPPEAAAESNAQQSLAPESVHAA